MSASNLTRGVYLKVRPLLVASADARLMLTRNYHEKVIDHYENPRNVGSFDKSDETVGTGLVGAPACGDVMKLQVSSTIPLVLWNMNLICSRSKLMKMERSPMQNSKHSVVVQLLLLPH